MGIRHLGGSWRSRVEPGDLRHRDPPSGRAHWQSVSVWLLIGLRPNGPIGLMRRTAHHAAAPEEPIVAQLPSDAQSAAGRTPVANRTPSRSAARPRRAAICGARAVTTRPDEAQGVRNTAMVDTTTSRTRGCTRRASLAGDHHVGWSALPM